MLPATGVICRRKKRRGLWHSGETVVPLCAIGQLATRLQQMELEKWYENTGYALQYYTARAYTPLSSKDGRGEVSWDETQPIQDFPFHWAGFQFDGISMICTPYGAAWIPIVRTSMYIPYMLIVSLFMSNLRHHIVTKKEKKKKKTTGIKTSTSHGWRSSRACRSGWGRTRPHRGPGRSVHRTFRGRSSSRGGGP